MWTAPLAARKCGAGANKVFPSCSFTPNILPTQSRLRLSDPGPDAIISHDGRPQKLRAVFGDVAEMTVFGSFHNRV
ncbi:hypothetical protein F0726_02993 [Acidithiobacillus caldus]|nr:hypothetical protein F0726_02993 [Acidithiobacillus caldus]